MKESLPTTHDLSRIPYEPVPLWVWNERMDPDAVALQNRLLREGGHPGGFIHVRKGLLDSYMGPDFMRAVDAVAEDCRRTEQWLWIYDENHYPSGFAGGSVPRRGEAFRHKALLARPVGETPPPGSTPVGVSRDGVQVYRWVASLGRANFNNACYADTLNPQAVDAFIEDCYAPYIERYGTDARGRPLVAAFFTDEPIALTHANAPHGAAPWTDRLPERFRAEHGYDPLPWLHLLFTEGEGAGRFRLHFYRTVDRCFRENYTIRLADWCAAHGVVFTGHYDCEEILFKQQLRGVNVMTQYRHMDVPGIDHLGLQVRERLTGKQCQSVVNQFNKRRMMSETGGCGGHGMTFPDRTWIYAQQVALGVNWFVPHLATYSLVGDRKRDWPPSLFYQQPWWPGQLALSRRTARLCELMSEGVFAARVLVIHPRESAALAWTASYDERSPGNLPGPGYEPTAPGVRERLLPVQDHLEALCDALLGSHIPFDFGDESVMEDAAAHVAEGMPEVRMGAGVYHAMVLPQLLTLRPATVELLERFIRAGGRVFATADLPGVRDGLPQALPEALQTGVRRIALDQLGHELRSVGVGPAIETVEPELRPWVISHVRQLADGTWRLYVVNLNRCQSAIVRLADGGEAVAHDLDDEALLPDALANEFVMAPGEDRLITWKASGARSAAIASSRAASATDLGAPDRIERLDDNALPLDMVRWREAGRAWSSHPVYVLALWRRLKTLKYRGPLSVRYPLVVHDLAGDRRVRLVVENAGRYTLSLNGARLNWDGHSHWRDLRWHELDIRHALKPGNNTVEIECADFDAATMDIDAAFVIGDFAVRGDVQPGPQPRGWIENGLPPPTLHRVSAAGLGLTEPYPLRFGDLSAQGLPFYAGRVSMVYERRIEAGARLVAPALDMAVNEIRVGGVSSWTWLPWQRGLLLEQAVDRIEVIAYGDLRNLLGPHHNPKGDLPTMPPQEFWPGLPAGWKAEEAALRWANGEIPSEGDWQPDYSVRAQRLGTLTVRQPRTRKSFVETFDALSTSAASGPVSEVAS